MISKSSLQDTLCRFIEKVEEHIDQGDKNGEMEKERGRDEIEDVFPFLFLHSLGREFDVQARIQNLTFDLISLISFGQHFGNIEEEHSDFADAFETVLERSMK